MMTREQVKEIKVLCACSRDNAIKVPPKGFEHLLGLCFRCLCKLRTKY